MFWTDAYETHKIAGTQAHVVQAAKLVIRETKGFLVHQDEERVILARHYDPVAAGDEEPEVDSIIVIPTVLVKMIRPNGHNRKRKEQPQAEARAVDHKEAGDGEAK